MPMSAHAPSVSAIRPHSQSQPSKSAGFSRTRDSGSKRVITVRLRHLLHGQNVFPPPCVFDGEIAEPLIDLIQAALRRKVAVQGREHFAGIERDAGFDVDLACLALRGRAMLDTHHAPLRASWVNL